MVMKCTTLGLLKYFFTPIKLYGDSEDNEYGGNSDAANNAAHTDDTFGTNYSGTGLDRGDYEYTQGSKGADISGQTARDNKRAQTDATFADFYASIEKDFSNMYSGNNLVSSDYREYDDRTSIDWAPGSITGDIAMSVINELTQNTPSMSLATNIREVKAPLTFETNEKGELISTTFQTPNSLGGWDVYTNDLEGMIQSADSYVTRKDGTIAFHNTEVKLGGAASYSYDTHYWNGMNEEFGFAAELTADIAELLGFKTETARFMAATVEVAMLLYNVVLPAMQMVSAGFKLYSVSKTYSLINLGLGVLGLYKAINELNTKFGNEFGENVDNYLTGSHDEGDEPYDIAEVVNYEMYHDDFGPFLAMSNSLSSTAAMMPMINSRTKYIKPQINKEDNMQSQQAVFIDYRGGLSEVLASNLIGANEGSVYQNISIDKGTMESMKLGNVITSKEEAYYKYLPNDFYFYSEFPFSYTELGNFAYLTIDDDSLNGVYQLDYVGLNRNCTTSDLVQVQLIEPSTDLDIDAVGSSELDKEIWEEYTYAYTYYDRDTGFESAPKFSTTHLKKTAQLDVTDISYSTEENVDYIRLYRLGGYSTQYRLITEIENTALTGQTSYRDSLSEEYNPVLMDTQNLVIVEGLKQLTEHKGTLFGYKDNRVYFSRPGKPNMWSEFNSVRTSGVVSGIASSPLGLLIFTSNSQTYLLGGTDKYNFVMSALAKSIGCISYKSIANLKNAILWLDYEGLMMSAGSTVSNISKEKVDLTNIGEIKTSLVYDNVYYLIGTNFSLFVDFRYNVPSFKKVTNIDFITVHKGKLYMDSGATHYEDFDSSIGDYMEMTYKAPMFIGNSYDILTEFEKINLTFKGDFTFNIYVDEVLIMTDIISSNTVKVEEIKIATDSNEGLGIELELIGEGEIKAFRYIFSNVNIN